MLELLEIIDGAILVAVHLALTLLIPLAFFGAAAGVIAVVVRLPLSFIPGLAGERGQRSNALVAFARALISRAFPFAIGAAAVLVALDRLGGDVTGDPVAILGGGIRALVLVLGGVQDAAIRGWTALPPAEVIARATAVDGARPLAVITQLVGARVATLVPFAVPPDTFRTAFAAALAASAGAAIGASPLRALRGSRRASAPAPRGAWPVDVSEGDA